MPGNQTGDCKIRPLRRIGCGKCRGLFRTTCAVCESPHRKAMQHQCAVRLTRAFDCVDDPGAQCRTRKSDDRSCYRIGTLRFPAPTVQTVQAEINVRAAHLRRSGAAMSLFGSRCMHICVQVKRKGRQGLQTDPAHSESDRPWRRDRRMTVPGPFATCAEICALGGVRRGWDMASLRRGNIRYRPSTRFQPPSIGSRHRSRPGAGRKFAPIRQESGKARMVPYRRQIGINSCPIQGCH